MLPSTENSYSVYVHVFPNGKKYFGITLVDPERRWRNGMGYLKHKIMLADILHYGWGNITHIILAVNLSQYEAEELEIGLIKAYRTYDTGFGYNVSLGGNHLGKTSEITKEKLRLKLKGRVMSIEHKAKIGLGRRGKLHSDEAKAKIAAAALGRKREEASRLKQSLAQKGRQCSQETRLRISAAKKGHKFTLTARLNMSLAQKKRTPEQKEKARIARIGRKLSMEHRASLSRVRKGRKILPETKAKMSAARQRWWMRRNQNGLPTEINR